METLLYIPKQVLVIFLLFSWITDFANDAVATQDPRSSQDISSGYFFYQQSEYPRDCQEVIYRCSSSNISEVYVIKPDGYPDPFEVYGEVGDRSSGWTVIQRRVGGLLNFNRLWKDYKDGFGFLSTNYWIGNDKLSYLSNQGVYELRVNMDLANGSSVYIAYNGFRISDEWDEYSLRSLGNFTSGGDGSMKTCPRNMLYGNCTCTGTCVEPNGLSGCNSHCALGTEGCFCPVGFFMDGEDCVPASDCPCFWGDVNVVVPNGQSYVNDECTERRSCTNNQLVRSGEYQCDTNAQCAVRDDRRQCICVVGYEGDGQNCTAVYKDCHDVYNASHTRDGVYTVLPSGWPESPFDVYCAMSNGGGWTVFQRRSDNDRGTNFYRNWAQYREGFGNLTGSFWLGNEKFHYLTRQRNCKLRVDIVTSENSAKYAVYTSFATDAESNKYRLTVSGYSGNAGNGMYGAGQKAFSTHDRDNDACGNHNCAARHNGAWWRSNQWCSYEWHSYCQHFNFHYYYYYNTRCTYGNLNSAFNGGNGRQIFWGHNPEYCNVNSAEMRIRPSI